MSGVIASAASAYSTWRKGNPDELPLGVRVFTATGTTFELLGLSVSSSADAPDVVMLAGESATLPVLMVAPSQVVAVEFSPTAAPDEQTPFGFALRT